MVCMWQTCSLQNRASLPYSQGILPLDAKQPLCPWRSGLQNPHKYSVYTKDVQVPSQSLHIFYFSVKSRSTGFHFFARFDDFRTNFHFFADLPLIFPL